MSAREHIRIATRRSPLALWQAEFVKSELTRMLPGVTIDLLHMTTSGDRFLDASLAAKGGKGLFVKELETALLDGRADLAVHSMKDVPVALPPGLMISAILKRHDPRDAWVSSRFASLAALPDGGVVATSSLRRKAQLLMLRPDLEVVPLRGNVNTRLAKLDAGEFDAAVLAVSGLERLGFGARVAGAFSVEEMIPAIAQGALGIETRRDDDWMNESVAALNDAATHTAVTAERALNAALAGGCHLPVAAFATVGDEVALSALVADDTGTRSIRDSGSAPVADAAALGAELGLRLIDGGAGAILDSVRP